MRFAHRASLLSEDSRLLSVGREEWRNAALQGRDVY